MKLHCTWNEKMKFTAEADDHKIEMDTQPPIGADTAPSPFQSDLQNSRAVRIAD